MKDFHKFARIAAQGQVLPLLALLPLVLLGAAGCIDLGLPAIPADAGDGGPSAVTDGGESAPDAQGAAAALLAPLPDVPAPTNLTRVVLRLPEAIDDPTKLALVDAGGASVHALPRLPTPDEPMCAGEAPGTCVTLELGAPLAPGAWYRVDGLPAGVDGAALGFWTGDAADDTPPLATLAVAIADGCAVARVVADEPVWAVLTLAPAGASGPRAAPAAGLGTAPEIGYSFAGDPGDEAWAVGVTLVDLAGNTTALALDAPLATVPPPGWAISEVLANPLGAEPAQEWIEVLRTGATPASLLGLRISDGAGEDDLPDVTVAPGERVLIVPSGYNAAAPGDVAPAPGTLLARLTGGTIGQGGLSNAGEPVLLLDATGTPLSVLTPYYDTSTSAWAGRSVERIRPGLCDVRANVAPNATHAATPGKKNSVEE